MVPWSFSNRIAKADGLAGGNNLPRGPRRHGVIGRGAALEHDPLSTPEHMLPKFLVQTFGIIEQEDIVMPDLRFPGAMDGTPPTRISAVAELRVVAFAAKRALNPQHLITRG
jgi:hypothetical protein